MNRHLEKKVALGALGLGLAMGLAGVACKGRSSTRSTKAATARTCGKGEVAHARAWLESLCRYDAMAFRSPSPHWWGLRLSPAGNASISQVPRGTVLVLTPRALFIQGKAAPHWPKPKWRPPDLRAGEPALITAILRRLQGASPSGLGSAGEDAMGELMGRSVTDDAREAPSDPSPPALGPAAVPSGHSLLTLTVAKRKLTDKVKVAIVAVEPETPAVQVVHLFTLIKLAGYDAVGLLGSPTVATPKPPQVPDPSLRRTLGVLRAGQNKSAVVAGWHKALRQEERRWIRAGCKAMSALRRQRRKAKAVDLCGLVAKQIPALMKACNCAVAPKRLLTLWHALLTLDQPIGVKVARLSPGHPSPILTSESETWAKVGPKLMKSGKATDLWLKLRSPGAAAGRPTRKTGP